MTDVGHDPATDPEADAPSQVHSELDARILEEASRRRRPAGPVTGFARFLCFLTGFDTVDREQAEVTRAITRGALLLATTCLAGLSGFLFGLNLLHLGVLSAPFAMFWAFFVLSIDRYIIVSLDHQGSQVRRWTTGIIRLVLAILIGYVVAVPVILQVFSKEIQFQITMDNPNASAKATQAINANPEFGTKALADLKAAVAEAQRNLNGDGTDPSVYLNDPTYKKLSRQIAPIQQQITDLQQQLQNEVNGQPGQNLSGLYGNGPKAQALSARIGILQQQIQPTVDELNQVKQQLLDTAAKSSAQAKANNSAKQAYDIALANYNFEKAKYDSFIKEAENASGKQDGLATQIDALGEVRAKHGSVDFMFWLLTFLLITLDTSAVAMKLLESPTRDDALRMIDDEATIRGATMLRENEIDQLSDELAQRNEELAVLLNARQEAAEDRADIVSAIARRSFEEGFAESLIKMHRQILESEQRSHVERVLDPRRESGLGGVTSEATTVTGSPDGEKAASSVVQDQPPGVSSVESTVVIEEPVDDPRRAGHPEEEEEAK